MRTVTHDLALLPLRGIGHGYPDQRLKPFESIPRQPYVVATNLFLAHSRGCHLSVCVACCDYLKRRRTAHASPTPSPALVNRNGPTAARGRLRPRDPSGAPMGRYLSVGGAGYGRGPEFRPALSDSDGPRPGTGSHAGLVSLGITQARTAL